MWVQLTRAHGNVKEWHNLSLAVKIRINASSPEQPNANVLVTFDDLPSKPFSRMK
jgi:hypothetical protein